MNRDCLIAMFGVLVHNDTMTRAAAEYYLHVIDDMLEDGITVISLDAILEVLNG